MSKTRSGARFTFLQKWNLFGAFIRLEFLRVYVLGCQIEINIVFAFFNLSPYATKNSVSRHVHAFITETTFLQTQTLLSSVVALIALLSIGQIDLILAATYFFQCLILIVE